VSLSNTQVADLLNRYFVPVYLSNEDYRDDGPAPAEERAELLRIHQQASAAQLSVGTVHAFVLGPDGQVLDSMHTVEVAKPERLVAMLERVVRKLGTAPGEALVKPAPPAPPAAPAGGLRLHIVARYLERQGDSYVLIRDAGGNWSALPGEDWVSLDASQLAAWLPAGGADAADSWTIPPAAARPLFERLYPPTENNDLATNRILHQSLQATMVRGENPTTARLVGRLRMRHPFYHRDDGKEVEATLAGYLDFDPASARLRALRLVTDVATYGDPSQRLPFGAAVRSAD
jgi:hypothetical protein